MSRPAITSKDAAATPRKAAAMDHRRRIKDADVIKANLSGKKFADLLPLEKEDLLKALGISMGFIARD